LIDTHCHLLPHLDDGPRSRAEAVQTARRLANDGISVVLCTPHYSRAYPTPLERAREELELLRNALMHLNIPLTLHLAAEVSPPMLLEAPADELAARSFGGQYLLVEIKHDTPNDFVRIALEHLRRIGLIPIFAHPERSQQVGDDLHLLESAREAGALVQVVAPSIAGSWGTETRLRAWRLVAEGVADLVATDAHGAAAAPLLATIANYVEERIGNEQRRALFEGNAARLLAGARGRAPTP
jgi:protein-tyrosine phosphatase